ncbi:MAG: sodium:calcium antiporter [Verrucomicrobiae bacterium]|nr:sodium:calcium antiporter [Verrucomicrobiae bacterium]
MEMLPLWGLLLVIVAMLFVLAKGADLLVEEAVTLSIRWGVPTLVVGATIVSLGTTLPETAVSVAAALGGRPDLALGNAVGSIICDTGLILGLGVLLGTIPLERGILERQSWIQLGAGLLLIALCMPWSSPATVFETGGRLPQWGGWLLVLLLVLYIGKTIQWARQSGDTEVPDVDSGRSGWVLVKLGVGIGLVVLSSKVLIPSVEEFAERLHVPRSVIGATLVAFGTSLPELVTVLTSVRKGHGALALGNVIGADILNVLFVAGTAAAVTRGGLEAEPRFFVLLFPAMLGILLVFRVSAILSGDRLRKWTGWVLLGAYAAVTLLSYRR